jgi:hypothetical protein
MNAASAVIEAPVSGGLKGAERVWHALRVMGRPASRADLAELAHVPPRTVERLLSRLSHRTPPLVRCTRPGVRGREALFVLVRDPGPQIPRLPKHWRKPVEWTVS